MNKIEIYLVRDLIKDRGKQKNYKVMQAVQLKVTEQVRKSLDNNVLLSIQ